MILEIWILLATIGIILLIGGALYAKISEGKIFLLMLDLPFLVMVALYSFDIEKSCCGSTSMLSTTYIYSSIGAFFGFLILLNVLLVILFTVTYTADIVSK